jgi:DNA adenine methylase
MPEAEKLAECARKLPCGFALSMWLENKYRKNEYIERCWSGLDMRICTHFYHVGSTEGLRNEIDEVLVIKPGFSTPDIGKQSARHGMGHDTAGRDTGPGSLTRLDEE